MKTTAPERLIRCRYLRKTGLRCESPATDQSPDALIHLCIHHFARALELFQERRAQVQAERRG